MESKVAEIVAPRCLGPPPSFPHPPLTFAATSRPANPVKLR